MKKLILTSALLLGSLYIGLAQSVVATEIYDQYSDIDNALALSLNYDMVDILDLDLEINDQMKHISGDVYQIKFIAFGDESKPGMILSEITRKLAFSDLEELEIPKDVDDEEYSLLKFYGERKGSYFSDICMVILSDDGETGAFIAVNGKIKIRRES
jgi:hypothetical protein